MRRFLFSVLLVLIATGPGAVAGASQSAACGDIEGYLTSVDASVVEQTMALVGDPEWVSGAEALTEHLVATDGDFEGLTVEQLDPMIQLWSVPMHVLGEVPAGEIPAEAQALHDSSLEQWTLMPELLSTMATSGPFAAFAFVEELERITNENWAAQESVRTACADLVASYDTQREHLITMFQVMDSGDLTPIIQASADDLHGLGVTYLFFAEEEDVTATPAS